MTPVTLLKTVLRPLGLALYFAAYGFGYVWGHLSGGFYDGAIEAHKETE